MQNKQNNGNSGESTPVIPNLIRNGCFQAATRLRSRHN